jgi:hypothetical protein
MPDKVLESVDQQRRGFLKRLAVGGFAAPLIASFSLESLMATSASAMGMSNTTSNTNDDLLFLDFFDDGHGH